ncbi:hypothetical protein [Antrihabitans sp. YC2-6]|uniref:hypothetical protein n=1 Tax=Antrihabitans sp. YC2-6 TaxID=2799498 RepID=UPI0018F3278A|nr:hypothetical protein [Antrihabitans sp. YC2-6]MBJ8347506.1 hypothetical protein [Antrihabitans sp. YC2-6]
MIRRLIAAPMAAAAIFVTAGSVAVIAASPAIAAPATPSPGELQGKLQSALAGNSAELESGNASSLGVVNQRIAAIPGYSWDISGPVNNDGSTLSATLHSRLGSYDYPVLLTWVDSDGMWKLSQASENEILAIANLQWN